MVYEKKVLLLGGRMQSGKNTIANKIVELTKERGLLVRQLSFAKPIKDMCAKKFNTLAQMLNSIASDVEKFDVEGFKKLRIKDENWYEDKTDITRTILQTIGTDFFREEVDNNFWIDKCSTIIDDDDETNLFIITDYRFPNEFYRINSSGKWDVYTANVVRETKTNNSVIVEEHESEKALLEQDFGCVVVNKEGNDIKELVLKEFRFSCLYI